MKNLNHWSTDILLRMPAILQIFSLPNISLVALRRLIKPSDIEKNGMAEQHVSMEHHSTIHPVRYSAMRGVQHKGRGAMLTWGSEQFKLLREALAALEHDQWIAWSQDIAATETITPARRERWERLWQPYHTLTESQKEQDREWADQVIAIIRRLA